MNRSTPFFTYSVLSMLLAACSQRENAVDDDPNTHDSGHGDGPHPEHDGTAEAGAAMQGNAPSTHPVGTRSTNVGSVSSPRNAGAAGALHEAGVPLSSDTAPMGDASVDAESSDKSKEDLVADGSAQSDAEVDDIIPTAGATRWLAFHTESISDGSRPLFLLGVPNGPGVTQLAPSVASYQWSSDGKHLLYWTSSVDSSPNGAYLTSVGDEGFTEPTLIHAPLESNMRVKFASLSPDGNTIALQLFEHDTTRWYVRSASASPDAWTSVGYGAAGEHDADSGKFAWSPDGTRAAIVEFESDTYQRLLLVDSDGEWSEARYEDLWLVEWSKDSSQLLVNGLYDASLGTRALFLVNGAEALTVTEPSIHENGWSAFSTSRIAPNGAAVAFAANIADEFDLFVKHLDDVDPAVKLDGRHVQAFDWFPDSQRIYYWGYSLEDDDGPHLYSRPANGGTFVKLNPSGTLAHCNSGACIKRSATSVVFTTLNAEQTGNQLFDFDLASASTTPRAISRFPDGVFVDYFSPDTHGQVLTIVTNAEGTHDISVIDRNGPSSESTLVTSMPAGTYPGIYDEPWAPDSRYFLFIANHDLDVDGNSDLIIAESSIEGWTVSEPFTSNDGSFSLVGASWQP